MLLIFNILLIVDLGEIITMINITKGIILIMAIIKTTMGVSYGEESVIFVVKKVIALIDIQMMNNRKQRTLETKPSILQR